MWKIHGYKYDLSNFMDRHPGGRQILELTKGDSDLTPLFESYHAFSDLDKIKLIMEKYKIDKCEDSIYTFKKDDFYYTLKNRVRKILKNTKGDYKLFFYIHFMFAIYFITYINAFIIQNNFYLRLFFAIFSGISWISIGFTVMHNASHLALFKNHRLNNLYSYLWNEFGFWNDKIWIQHHVYKHHAYTGDPNNDPDQRHFKPLIRKNKIDLKNKYIKFFQKNILFAMPLVYIFPGMYLGQLQSYIKCKITNRLYNRVDIYKNKTFYSEILLKLLSLYTLFYNFNIYVLLTYLITLNLTYSFNIIPDHDMLNTSNNKLLKGDWGETQVRNSGNFITNNYLYSYIFGGINYQIEHHLFPSLCPIHYHKIQNIVKQTCKEFNIPYIDSDGLFKANIDGIKNFIDISKSN